MTPAAQIRHMIRISSTFFIWLKKSGFAKSKKLPSGKATFWPTRTTWRPRSWKIQTRTPELVDLTKPREERGNRPKPLPFPGKFLQKKFDHTNIINNTTWSAWLAGNNCFCSPVIGWLSFKYLKSHVKSYMYFGGPVQSYCFLILESPVSLHLA